MRTALQAERHGMLIFAEGQRSLDGQIRPFKTANVNRLRGRAEGLGAFEPRADPQRLPAFLAEQRATRVRQLERMRARADVR